MVEGGEIDKRDEINISHDIHCIVEDLPLVGDFGSSRSDRLDYTDAEASE